MVLATGVVIRALYQRSNFYSVCVYLAQSNACLMVEGQLSRIAKSLTSAQVLTNTALLSICTGMFGLQKIFYGPLRPIEVEQLYEKAWFAITETCLAMTIFREEVGGWFLVMFVGLLIGKVWGWMGDGRVEILEQQPPLNPRLFHVRLSVSLTISTLFNLFLLRYSVNTVLLHARPNMMVMFAFEFAVLTITSLSTAARYTISLREASVIDYQITERRAQIRRNQEQARSHSAHMDSTTSSDAPAQGVITESDIDSLDIDVPGWEEKGRWVFYLDLTTGVNERLYFSVLLANLHVADFFKLVLYLTFFCVLCMFYGMPIHIIRDVALTIRSFYKRVTDFIRYRQATRDMNTRYPDATAEEVAREEVCIICREEMRPWQQLGQSESQQPASAGPNGTTSNVFDERLRPKKLPCGHILHFSCLRSWLERQQNCPTCRRPVLVSEVVGRAQEQVLANQLVRAQVQVNHPPAQDAAQRHLHPPEAGQNVFNLGPLRIAFGARQIPLQQAQNHQQASNQQGPIPAPSQAPRAEGALRLQSQAPGSLPRSTANLSPTNLQLQLHQIEQQLSREINGLRTQQNQLYLIRALQGELARLRIRQALPETNSSSEPSTAGQQRTTDALSQTAHVGQTFAVNLPHQPWVFGHQNLPVGMTLPPGWAVLPLQRIQDGRSPHSVVANEASISSIQSQNSGGNPRSGSNVPLAATLSYQPNPYDNAAAEGRISIPSRVIPEDQNMTGSLELNQAPNQSLACRDRQPTETSIPADGPSRAPMVGGGITQSDDEETSSRHPMHPTVPSWSSDASPSRANGHQKDVNMGRPTSREPYRHDAPTVDDHVPLQCVADSKQTKGKGRAMTIEDCAEDDG